MQPTQNKSTKTILVGIAGGTGSGKSYFANLILKALPDDSVTVLSVDNYYPDISKLPLSQRRAINFDEPKSLELNLLATHLGQLKAGQPIPRLRYDFETNARHILRPEIMPTAVVLIEGLFALAETAVRKELDIKVYIDTPDAERLRRRIVRDSVERDLSEEETKRNWITSVSPGHEAFINPSKAFADIVTEGDQTGERLPEALMKRLEKHIEDWSTAFSL